eukprot:scaffold126678_cov25-Prasinocladus_malaysianus.AAC.1
MYGQPAPERVGGLPATMGGRKRVAWQYAATRPAEVVKAGSDRGGVSVLAIGRLMTWTSQVQPW